MQISDNTRGALYMCVAMAAFTVNDSFMKAATQVLPLFQAITLRGFLCVVVLSAIAAATGGLWPKLSRKDAIALTLRSAAEVGGTVLFLAALVHMPLANISAILQSLPLAVTLTAALVFGDKIGWRRMVAITAGFIGVLIIIRPGGDVFDGYSVMAVASVVCVVVRDLATRQLSRAVPSVTVAVWAAVSVTAMGLLGSLSQPWVAVDMQSGLTILASASALIVGYMFVVMVMRVGDISFVAPFRYVSLLVAIILGWVMFKTFPDFYTLVGAAIVVASGIFTLVREGRLARAARKNQASGAVDIPCDSPYTPPT